MSIEVFEFPANFSIQNLNALQEVWSRINASTNDSIDLDLSKVNAFTPFSACYFAAIADDIKQRIANENLEKGVITLPEQYRARRQFEYLGLESYFTGKRRKHSTRVRTVPMNHLLAVDYDVAFKMAALLRRSYNLGDAHFYLARLCLKELFQNAFEHSETKSGVYACAYGIKSERFVRLCVLDRGIGIRAHLRRNPAYKSVQSDAQALGIATEKGVTGKKQSRGLGLFFIKRLLQDIGGQLVIASGDALMSVSPPSLPEFINLESPFRGTAVSVMFHAKEGYRFLQDDYEED